MNLLNDFARVSARRPCPICGRPDWCLVSRDDQSSPSKAICARVESKRRFGQAGWLHVLGHDGERWDRVRRARVRIASAQHTGDLTLAAHFREDLHDALNFLARDLGVSAKTCSGSASARCSGAWTFPMVDGEAAWLGSACADQTGASTRSPVVTTASSCPRGWSRRGACSSARARRTPPRCSTSASRR